MFITAVTEGQRIASETAHAVSVEMEGMVIGLLGALAVFITLIIVLPKAVRWIRRYVEAGSVGSSGSVDRYAKDDPEGEDFI